MGRSEVALYKINKLVEFCFSNETSATFGGSGSVIHLIKDKMGAAMYIYGEEGYNDDFYVSLDNKFQVVAIATKEIVYIINTYMFNRWVVEDSNKELPDNVKWFSDFQSELNDKLINDFFPRYYENLVPTGVDDFGESTLLEFARTKLLGNDSSIDKSIGRESSVKSSDVARLLTACFGDEQTIFTGCLSRDGNLYDIRKSREVATEKYINKHDVVEDYELRIADAIRNTEAKNLIVWFEKNGKQAAAKITPYNLSRILIKKNDYFCNYHFVNGEEAKRMFSEIGVENKGWGDPKNRLITKDIVKIMYRGKAIYQREETI